MEIPSLLKFNNRSRSYYLVNNAGMGMSVALTLVAILFIYRELSTNRFHENIRNIYCVEVDGRANTPFIFAEILKDQLPGVSSYTRVQFWDLKFNVLRNGTNPPLDLDKIIRADTNFFRFFTFRFISGDPRTCLEKPESIVLTESSAVNLFGNDDPIGKTLSYNKGQMLLTVTAIVKDPPFNSSIDFNAVMSVNSLPVIYPPYRLPGPFFWSFETFVIMNGVMPDDLMNRTASVLFFRSIPAEGIKEAQDIFKSRFMVRLIPFSKVYFNKEYTTSLRIGDIKQVYLFSVIGFLIILVVLVNFVNLSVAGATIRIRDVMIRKIMGASTGRLLIKFLLESVILGFSGVLLGLVLGKTLTNFINSRQFLSNPVEFFNLRDQVIIIAAGSLFIGLAGGIYPAVKLSMISTSESKKHTILSGAVFIRKMLLMFQFFVSAGLLICAIVMSRQYRSMAMNPAGFDSENVLYLRMGTQLKSSCRAFTDKLATMPAILKVAQARYGFIGGRNPAKWEFICNGNNVNFDAISFTTDTGFMELMGLQIQSGNSFTEHDNIQHKLIINEAAMKMMGNPDDLSGITLPDKVHGITWQVVGVVKDFNTRSMQYPVSPYVFYYTPGDQDMDGLYIKIRQGENIGQNMDIIRKTIMEFSPDEPVDLKILDDAKAAIYREDDNRRKMFMFFSVFVMLISCMGLYALSGMILGRRTKETGIRKVYGAEKRSILFLLSSDLGKIVLTGYLFALPLSWFLMNKWLQNFTLKTSLPFWIFLLSGVIISLTALLSIALEIRKISSKNVADILRYE
jgi:putative ABC transport system permease protein